MHVSFNWYCIFLYLKIVVTQRKTGNIFKAWVWVARTVLCAVTTISHHPVRTIPTGKERFLIVCWVCWVAKYPRVTGIGRAGIFSQTGLSIPSVVFWATSTGIVLNVISGDWSANHIWWKDVFITILKISHLAQRPINLDMPVLVQVSTVKALSESQYCMVLTLKSC